MESIIQIRANDVRNADAAFAEFMRMTEDHLNDMAAVNKRKFHNCAGVKLEKIALQAMKDISVSAETPFAAANIRRVKPSQFPDIVAEKYYGVEVKSTEKDSWTSTGSSIIESTRVNDVDNIYMLFGKLGGIVKFKCKPYQDCLSEISVTHAPRYLIDMNIPVNETVFSKIGTEYDQFRLKDEHEKIKLVRNYYRQKAEEGTKKRMPWWIGNNNTSDVMLSLYSELSQKEKKPIVTKAFVLFPEEILNKDYKRAALWICTRQSYLVPNVRDLFSAGGKVEYLGNIKLPHKMPKVLGRIYNDRKNIVKLLKEPDEDFLQDIAYCWGDNVNFDNLLDIWLEKAENGLVINKDMNGVHIKEIFADVL